MSMVERVARTIHEHHAFECIGEDTPWDEVNEVFEQAQDDYRKVARAVIEAMREPTDEIKEAGSGFIYEAWGDGKIIAAEAWEAMIDAALKDKA